MVLQWLDYNITSTIKALQHNIYNPSAALGQQYQGCSEKLLLSPIIYYDCWLSKRVSRRDELSISAPAALCVDPTALVWGESGKPPSSLLLCRPTDVVISHWNLNQTINTRQLSCSKKRRCLHNTACQGMLAGLAEGDGFWLSDTVEGGKARALQSRCCHEWIYGKLWNI